jgi:quercetin dioxygenase-like cupin family protein
MHISSLETAPKTVPVMEGASGIEKQIPISRADGTPSFSLRVFTIDPGGHTPLHRHAFEHLNYVIDGVGAVVADDGPKALKKGDFVLVQPGEMHQYRNTSNVPFVVLCGVPKEYE